MRTENFRFQQNIRFWWWKVVLPLRQCEMTKNDETVHEPSLERGMITRVEIFSKFRFYSCPDSLECRFFLSFLEDFAKS